MGFFSKLKGLFSGRGAVGSSGSGERKGFFERARERREKKKIAREWKKSQERKGFFERARERREKKKIAREWKKSQERMEKMEKESLREKARRKAQEREKKKADQERREAAHEKSRGTFKDNWGFNDQEYDDFIHFIDGASDELKEVFGSNNLVEAFRTGRSLGLSSDDMKAVLDQTYNMTEGGTQEDVINDLYINMEAYAAGAREGSYV